MMANPKIGQNTSDGCGEYPTSIRGMSVDGGDDDFYVQKVHPSAEERKHEVDESGLKAPGSIAYPG